MYAGAIKCAFGRNETCQPASETNVWIKFLKKRVTADGSKLKEKMARGGKLVDGVICPEVVYRARRRRLTTTRDKRSRFAITTNNIIRQRAHEGWGGGGGENTRLPSGRARVSSRNLCAHVTCARFDFCTHALHTVCRTRARQTRASKYAISVRLSVNLRAPVGCLPTGK